ncbi:hypothetical protein [Enterovibrio paralichthyis]|uniref:hypothetical protein n=1 Tax=Enterovibrio paralichthyis TaxID=2853805 RepID=UPI001C447C55|nr:hypothetical protein [Enterovibrio paralichthyis]MBV7300245.1 hypothetical protein [Enterovibrio paralichthyis]
MQSFTYDDNHNGVYYRVRASLQAGGFSAFYSFAAPEDERGSAPYIKNYIREPNGDLRLFENKEVAEKNAIKKALQAIDSIYAPENKTVHYPDGTMASIATYLPGEPNLQHPDSHTDTYSVADILEGNIFLTALDAPDNPFKSTQKQSYAPTLIEIHDEQSKLEFYLSEYEKVRGNRQLVVWSGISDRGYLAILVRNNL